MTLLCRAFQLHICISGKPFGCLLLILAFFEMCLRGSQFTRTDYVDRILINTFFFVTAIKNESNEDHI